MLHIHHLQQPSIAIANDEKERESSHIFAGRADGSPHSQRLWVRRAIQLIDRRHLTEGDLTRLQRCASVLDEHAVVKLHTIRTAAASKCEYVCTAQGGFSPRLLPGPKRRSADQQFGQFRWFGQLDARGTRLANHRTCEMGHQLSLGADQVENLRQIRQKIPPPRHHHHQQQHQRTNNRNND